MLSLTKMRLAVAGFLGILVVFLLAMHLYLLDGLDGWLFSTPLLNEAFLDDTCYASGYSDSGFRSVKKDMTVGEVRTLIGEPLWETWSYEGHGMVFVKQGVVTDVARSRHGPLSQVTNGLGVAQVLLLAGAPISRLWVYTCSPHSRSYRVRKVEFQANRVISKISRLYLD